MDVGLIIILLPKFRQGNTGHLKQLSDIPMILAQTFGHAPVWFLKCWQEIFFLNLEKGVIMIKMMII